MKSLLAATALVAAFAGSAFAMTPEQCSEKIAVLSKAVIDQKDKIDAETAKQIEGSLAAARQASAAGDMTVCESAVKEAEGKVTLFAK